MKKETKKHVKRNTNKIVLATLASTMAFGAMVPMSIMGAFAHEPEIETVEMNDVGRNSMPEPTHPQLENTEQDLGNEIQNELYGNSDEIDVNQDQEDSGRNAIQDADDENKDAEVDSENVQQNTEDKGDQVEDKEESEKNDDSENKEDKKINSLDDLWKAQQEEKELAEKKAKEEAEKKAKEAADKAIKDNVNKAGGILGDVVVKLVNNDYDSAGDAIKDVLKTTLSGLNESFIKNLPYVGGFMNKIISGFMKGSTEPVKSPLEEKMEIIHGDLKDIKECIDRGTSLIIENTNDTEINVKVGTVNRIASELNRFYDQYNTDFEVAMKEIEERGDKAAYDEISKTMKEIYSKDNPEYFEKYKEYVNVIINNADQLMTFDKFGGDKNIFGLADHIMKQNEKSATPLVEYKIDRANFVQQIKDFCDNGYDVLNVAIRAEYERSIAAHEVAVQQEERYTKLAENETDPFLRDIYKSKANEFNNMRFAAEKDYKSAKKRLEDLDQLRDDFYTACDSQLQNIINDAKTFDEGLVNLPKEAKVGTATFKTETISTSNGDVILYPYINEAKKMIEYKDQFGNIRATRNYKQVKVGQHAFKEGDIIQVTNGYGLTGEKVCDSFVVLGRDLGPGYAYYKSDLKNPIKVTRIWEESNWVFWSIRNIEGIDQVTGKPVKMEIGCSDLKENIVKIVYDDNLTVVPRA